MESMRLTYRPALLIAFSIAMFLLLCPSPASGEESYSILLFPPDSAADMEERAVLFSDHLRVRLINSNRLRVIDRELTRRTMVDLGFIGGMEGEGEEKLLEAARSLDADLYLSSSVSAMAGQGIINLEMVLTAKNQTIFTRTYAMEESPQRAARILSQEILDALTIARGITLSDVEALVDLEAYEEAARLLERYSLFHPVGTNVQELEKIIRKGLGDKAFQEAEQYRSLYLFDEALLSINQALMHEPENGLYKETALTIQEEAARFQQEETGEIVDAAVKLVEEKRFQVAQGLLELLYQRGGDDERIKPLAEAIRRGLREEEYMRKARIAYFNQEYVEARLNLREAIRLNPVNPEYSRFLQDIEKREKELEESRLRWSSYKGDLLSFEPVELFLDKKPLQSMPETGFIWGTYSWRDKDTLLVSTFPLTGIDGGYSWKRLLPLMHNLSFADLYFSYGVRGRLGYGLTEKEGLPDGSGYRDLQVDQMLIAQVGGTGSVELLFLSFLLNLGLEAGLGGSYEQQRIREPALNSEQVLHHFAFTPFGALSVSLSWLLNKDFRIRLGWSGQLAFRFPENGEERFSFSWFSLSTAFSL